MLRLFKWCAMIFFIAFFTLSAVLALIITLWNLTLPVLLTVLIVFPSVFYLLKPKKNDKNLQKQRLQP